MGIFSRFRKNAASPTSASAPVDDHRHAADRLEEVAEANETIKHGGAVSPMMASRMEPIHADEIRSAADPEEDNTKEQLIEEEREKEERDR